MLLLPAAGGSTAAAQRAAGASRGCCKWWWWCRCSSKAPRERPAPRQRRASRPARTEMRSASCRLVRRARGGGFVGRGGGKGGREGLCFWSLMSRCEGRGSGGGRRRAKAGWRRSRVRVVVAIVPTCGVGGRTKSSAIRAWNAAGFGPWRPRWCCSPTDDDRARLLSRPLCHTRSSPLSGTHASERYSHRASTPRALRPTPGRARGASASSSSSFRAHLSLNASLTQRREKEGAGHQVLSACHGAALDARDAGGRDVGRPRRAQAQRRAQVRERRGEEERGKRGEGPLSSGAPTTDRLLLSYVTTTHTRQHQARRHQGRVGAVRVHAGGEALSFWVFAHAAPLP